MSKIEWTEATWNPVVGCSVVSPGCTNCYAMRMANRLAANPATPHYAGTVEPSKAGPVWTGKLAMAPEKALTAPLRRRKPTMYFVNSMGDLFHEDVPDDWIDRVFAVMALCPQHTFQVLTKRANRMRAYVTDREDREIGRAQDRQLTGPHPVPVLPNAWLGVSAEDQVRADDRIPDLLATPAAVRFVSAEPLLGPVDLRRLAATGGTIRPYRALVDALDGTCQSRDHASTDWFKLPAKIDWVIVGGESGKGARPMHPHWARSLRDQCAAAGVPFFFKQWGEFRPRIYCLPIEDDDVNIWPDGTVGRGNVNDNGGTGWPLKRVGKNRAGRLLDGREWNGMPEIANA
jgi:protein gp37